MSKLTFIEHDGTEHEVQFQQGQTLMEAALDNDVPGIDADCGGACACGTCHVVLKPEWTNKVDDILPQENQMLDLNPERSASSRLACQINLDASHDGIVVQLPEFQM